MNDWSKRLTLVLAIVTVSVSSMSCGRIGVSLLPEPEQTGAPDAGADSDAKEPIAPLCAAHLGYDTDGDGVCGVVDNCNGIANRDQRDHDRDGQGDACDSDTDGDGQPDESDPCPLNSPDDSDGDGSCDDDDRCPGHDDASDADLDDVPDGCDLPSCGDGIVQIELGETCEPVSSSALCPDACNDGDVCTSDLLIGSTNACTAACTYRPISEPINDDGCCPSGQNALTDLDCSPVCGNDVVEPGEACDGGGRCRDCRTLFPSSLVHRYNFDGSGTMVVDTVGAAHGACVNTLVRGGAVDMAQNITGDYIVFPAGLISSLNEVTIELWLKWDGGPDIQRIFDFGNGDGTYGTTFFSLQPRDAQGRLAVTMNFTSAANDTAQDWQVADGAPLDKDAIHHLAVTFNQSTLALYVDGALRDASTRTPQPLSLIDDQNNWIGRSQDTSASELDAHAYEFRIYDKALTAAELQASYQVGSDR